MRIISKFKDYYDGGVSYGIDADRIYMREHVTRTIDTIRLPSSGFFNYPLNDFNLVGFCGEVYPYRDFDQRKFPKDPKQNLMYGMRGCYFQYEYYPSNNVIPIKDKRKRAYMKENYYTLVNSRKIKNLFLEYRTPVFHLKQKNRDLILDINPSLKDLAFYKVVDVYQAFQRISMFLGNELATEHSPEVPVGSDNVIRDSKGFDNKSFRKEKSKL